MSAPIRLQLSRQAGFNLQALSLATNGLPAMKVDRSTVFGNPYRIGEPVDLKLAKRWGWWPLGNPGFIAPDAETAVRRFTAVLALDHAIHGFIRHELAGKNLACWCASGAPCRADFLLILANGRETR